LMQLVSVVVRQFIIDGAIFFFLFFSIESYRLVFFVDDISTLVLNLLISNFCL